MVFVITSRGKGKGLISSRAEVGSWVIGYWRPKTHFEINVWNCFSSKAAKLAEALYVEKKPIDAPSDFQEVVAQRAVVAIKKQDASAMIEELPDGSVKLLITDPPHGDRIPYLELSEMWNAVLGEQGQFDQEIVVSNARIRAKTTKVYKEALTKIFTIGLRKLQSGGFLVVFFNSRRKEEWSAIQDLAALQNVVLVGCVPMSYSATSVVQDNREGAMKQDYIVVWCKGKVRAAVNNALNRTPGWTNEMPIILEKADSK